MSSYNNTFDDYNPTEYDLNVAFDRDDLVGISLCGDDPIFKREVVLKNLYDNIIDESVVPNEVNTVQAVMDDGYEFDETVPEPDYQDICPDDSDVSIDGRDAEDEIEAAQDIMSGEADEESDMIDYIEYNR